MGEMINNTLYQKPADQHDRLRERLGEYVKNKRKEHATKVSQRQVLKQQLRNAGLNGFDLLRPEALQIADTLVEGEKVIAAVCGRTKSDRSAMLVLTKFRIIYLNQEPFYTDMDEVSFGTIGGISLDVGLWSATISIYTPMGEFVLRTMNVQAAQNFVDWIERSVIVDGRTTLQPTFMNDQTKRTPLRVPR